MKFKKITLCNHLLFARALFVSALISSGSSMLACHKESSQKAATVQKSSETLGLENTLLTRIPNDAVGFLTWDSSHPAYKKLQASPWSGNQEMLKLALGADRQSSTQAFVTALKKSGIDINDQKSIETLFTSGALFTTAAQGNNPAAMGAVAQGSGLSDKLSKLKSELAAAGLSPKDLKVSHGFAYSFEVPVPALPTSPTSPSSAQSAQATPPQKRPVFVATEKDFAVLSGDQAGVDAVWNKSGTELPTLVKTATFRDSTTALSADESRFMFGYVDVAALVGGSQSALPAELTQEMPDFDPSKFPLKNIAMAYCMEESPKSHIRLTLSPSSEEQKAWLKTLKSSTSKDLASAVPANPLVFLSMDGNTLREIRDLLISRTNMASDSTKNMLAVLDNVRRVGLFARVATPGTSILPFPDVALLVESNSPEQTRAAAEKIAEQTVGQSMGGSSAWTESTVNGTKVRGMNNPLGYGIFVAQAKNLVLVASSSAAIGTTLNAVPKSEFLTSLPSLSAPAFSTEQSVGNVFVNFEQVANLMQSAKGMMSMFAPQASGEANKYLDQNYIESIKKMGLMVGTLTYGDKYLDITSSYEKIPADRHS